MDGQWKLTDYGLVTRNSTLITVKTPNLREPVYHAPELLSLHSTFDNKIDIWAFGCILFEMATQQAAFRGEGRIRKLKAGTGSTVIFTFDYGGVDKEISAAAKWTENLVQEMMQVDPDRRPSARSVLERIETFVPQRKGYRLGHFLKSSKEQTREAAVDMDARETADTSMRPYANERGGAEPGTLLEGKVM